MKADVKQTGLQKYNLKGFIVAHGVTDIYSDGDDNMFENLYRFQVIPKSYLTDLKKYHCREFDNPASATKNPMCHKVLKKIYHNFQLHNPYDLRRKNE